MGVHRMRVAGSLAAGIVLAVGLAQSGAAANAAEPGGAWGQAVEVRGTFSTFGDGSSVTSVASVSCLSGGYCAAVGNYLGSTAFVVSRQNGRWGKAQPVPGLDKFHSLGSQLNWVSCASPGNCAAGGLLLRPGHALQIAFVVSERNGKWGNFVPVAHSLNIAAASKFSQATHTEQWQAFVVNQRNGTWGKAVPVLRIPVGRLPSPAPAAIPRPSSPVSGTGGGARRSQVPGSKRLNVGGVGDGYLGIVRGDRPVQRRAEATSGSTGSRRSWPVSAASRRKPRRNARKVPRVG